MATYYIDPVSGSNGNDGLTTATPKLTVPTPTANNTYLLKRGTTYGLEILVGTGITGVTVGAYGEGARPIVNPGTASRWSVRVGAGATNCIVEDLECTGAAHPSLRTFGVYWGSGTGSGADGGILRRCKIHDFVGNSAGDCDGIQWFGDNGRIEFCEIYNCVDDGLWYEGLNPWIHHNHIYNVGTDESLTGDCIQLNGTPALTVGNAVVEYNILDHSANLEKQAFIVSGASLGSGGVFRYNTCTFPFDPEGAGGGSDNACAYSDQPGFSFIGNTLIGGTYGILIDAGAGQKIKNNLIYGAAYGITTANNPTGLLVDGNTVVDCWQGGIYLAAADATTYVRNNAVVRCVRGIATHGSIQKANNAYFGNTQYNWASIAGGGAIESSAVTADPLLTSDYKPTASSPLLGAGTHLGYTRDIDRKQRPNPPSIGAYDRATMRTPFSIF